MEGSNAKKRWACGGGILIHERRSKAWGVYGWMDIGSLGKKERKRQRSQMRVFVKYPYGL